MRLAEKRIRDSAARGLRGPTPKGEWSVCCPFCEAANGKPDRKFKLQLNPSKGVYYCYKCGLGGRVDLAWLGTAAAEPVAPAAPVDLGPPPEFIELWPKYGSPGWGKSPASIEPYCRYIRERGFEHAARDIGVGACLEGRYAGRVIVPHREAGQWIGFAARAIYPGMEPKYLYPAGMDRRNALWGGFLSVFHDELWLVEGVFDAMGLYPRAVASFGKDVSDEQLAKLALWGHKHRRLVVALDGDAWEDCLSTAMRLALRGCENVYWAKLPPATDPGTLGAKCEEYVRPLLSEDP